MVDPVRGCVNKKKGALIGFCIAVHHTSARVGHVDLAEGPGVESGDVGHEGGYPVARSGTRWVGAPH